MDRKKEHGVILLLVIAAAIVAVANGIGSSETYNGNLSDLLIDESDLPNGYVAGVVQDASFEDGWTFVQNPESEAPLFSYTPLEYDGVVFYDINENDDPEGMVLQVVMRCSIDDIDKMFDMTTWAFVPAAGLEEIEEDDDVRAKVLTYSEGEATTSIGLLVAKKDIAVMYAYSSSTEFDPNIIFSLATDVVQAI